MDEPLAALDEARKAEILPYIERLRDEAGVPIVYVSHAVSEVARLATTVVVLETGRVAAAGPAEAILRRADLVPVHEAEAGALLDMVVAATDPQTGLTHLTGAAGRLQVPGLSWPPGTRLRVRIPARDVLVAIEPPRGLSARNVLSGTGLRVDPSGSRDGGGDRLPRGAHRGPADRRGSPRTRPGDGAPCLRDREERRLRSRRDRPDAPGGRDLTCGPEPDPGIARDGLS